MTESIDPPDAAEERANGDASTLPHCKTPPRQNALGFVFLNALIVVGFALLHTFTAAADYHTQLSYRSFCCWIALETFILFSPGVIVYALCRRHLPRIATIACVASTLAISAIYFLDLAIVLTLREHLFSKVFIHLTGSVLPFIFDYISLKNLITFALITFGWMITQYSCWRLAGIFTKPRESNNQLSSGKAFCIGAVGAIPIVLALLPAFTHWDRTVGEVTKASERHPITASGFFPANRVPRLREETFDAVRGQAWMIDQVDRLPQFIQRYNQVVTQRIDDDKPLPDVMLVVSECLRPDAITPKTAPNIYRRAEKGLWLKQHYSAGNHSKFGFFGLMYGLDACWYERRSELKAAALFDGLKQVGYTTGFFGRDDFNAFGMDVFCGEQCFDMCQFIDSTDLTQCDQAVCRLAADFFERKGQYAKNPAPPRLAIVYLYSPHDYVYEAEDDIHKIGDSPAPKRRNEARFVNFLNSIHFIDRTIAPLLSDDRITFIMGDHGESFGEDKRLLHGTALSKVQLHTCCVGFGPGIGPRTVTSPTSHCDILPTIAQLLGVQYSDPSVFPGVSLLDPLPKQRIVACRAFSSRQYLFVKPNRALQDRIFGYQGFISWRGVNMLAPGATVDIYGDSLAEQSSGAGKWSDAEWMLSWMADRLGPGFAEIPVDPKPLLHQTIKHADPSIRLHAIQLIRSLGPRADEFLKDLQKCLLDPDQNVRDGAFALIHDIHRN